MRRKKILVHGTLDSLQQFFDDASSRDFDIVAILSDEPEKISVKPLDVFNTQAVNKFALNLIDGIIFTGKDKSAAEIFIRQGIAPRKIILWDAAQGWLPFGARDKDGSQIMFCAGLEFQIRNEDDAKFFQSILWRLQTQRQMKNLPAQMYPAVLAQQFQQRTGKKFDLNKPQTLTQKIQWLKIFDATPIKSRLADKYLVRRWVADKIGAQYLIPLLGVWDNFDDIDFDELPDQFVLKCNHGCSFNIIVRDKKTFDKQNAREKINAWLNVDFGAQNVLELHYTRINRKIIAEKFMQNGDLPDIDNYKFWCFNGEPIFCGFDSGRTADGNIDNLRIDYFDMDWKPNDFENGEHPRSDHPEKIPRPKNFKLMKKLAATLAEGFAFVRVDFYEIDGKVYFGEMTFTPGAGNFYYKSAGTDEYLGDLLKLPAITPPPPLVDNSVDYRVRQKFAQEIKFPPPSEKIPARKIIASLTTWPKRIGTVHLAIQTILNQTRRPDLTVLYLFEGEFPRREADLPRELLAMRSERFAIRWYKNNLRSHLKLIPALKDFPEDIIVTFDDDILYHPALIERLLIGYKKYPEMIQAHRAPTVLRDDSNNVVFPGIYFDRPTYLNKLTGVGSVLYPPHCLHEDVLREDKFMTLAPTNDDIWFWLMGVLNGRRVNVVDNNIDKLNYIPGTQAVGLLNINDHGEKLFFKQLENVLNAYPILRDMLLYEQRLALGK